MITSGEVFMKAEQREDREIIVRLFINGSYVVAASVDSCWLEPREDHVVLDVDIALADGSKG